MVGKKRFVAVIVTCMLSTPLVSKKNRWISFHRPLVILLSKTAPSFAALNDVNLQVSHKIYLQGKREMHLSAGVEEISPQMFQGKEKRPRVLELLPEVLQVSSSKTLVLKAEGIARPAVVTFARREIQNTSPAISLSEEQINVSGLREESFSENDYRQERQPFLSEELKRRWALTRGIEEVELSTPAQPSFQVRLREEISKELKEEDSRNGERWIKDSQGQPVVYVNSPALNQQSQSFKNNHYASNNRRTPSTQRSREQAYFSESQPKIRAKIYSFANEDRDRQRDLVVLRGEISVVNGLALAEGSSLFVYRTFEGEILEKGVVWLNEGRYEISFKGDEGYIEGVLLNDKGEVLGHQKTSLLNGDVRSQIEKVSRGELEKISLDINLDLIKKEATDGKEEEQTWRRDSFIVSILKNGKESHQKRKTISWIGFQEKTEKKAFSETLLSLLEDWIPELTDNSEGAIVWGKVVDLQGNPLAQAKVVASDPNSRVYYFSGFLPDGSLTQTSSNGEFIIVGRRDRSDQILNLDEGIQGIKVIYGEGEGREEWPTEMVAVQNGHVSTVELRAPEYRNVRFSFEGKKGRQEPDVYFSSVDRPVWTKDKMLLKVPKTVGPTYVETSATLDLMATVSTLKPQSQYLRVPRISKEWLEKTRKRLKIESLPETGVVFGWGVHSEYKVTLSHRREETSVAYFSQDGELSLDGGVAEGYFLIFNAPQGLNNVIVHDSYDSPYGEAVFLETQNISVVDSSRKSVF